MRAGRTDDGAGIQPDSDSACNGDDSSDRDDTETERIPAAALRPGDRVRVRPGEVVPADGTIRSGHSAFDESLLTGESNPVARSAGSRVLAGSVNGSGVVEVEVTSAGDATVLGGVLRQAEQAARERPAIAQLADRAAAWFIGGVLVLAVGVAIGWLLHDPARMIPVLVSVLVVTCPCALSLATPAAMTAALGALARTGLIATRANAVERLALATHCLADKTGTLTEGRFRLRSVTTSTDISESLCLALAAALERYATHTGGVTGRIDGVRYAVGSPEFVARTCGLDPAAFGVDGTDNDTSASSRRGRTPETAEPAAASAGIGAPAPGVSRSDETDDGATHVFLAREGTLLARFVLADTLRADAIELVEGLRRRGIETTIASGDSAAAARADAVLIGDDPGRLLSALDIARRARRIVKQNLAWALGYNRVALPLAAAGAVPPWAAAIGMSLSSLAVAANALRLGRGPDTTGS